MNAHLSERAHCEYHLRKVRTSDRLNNTSLRSAEMMVLDCRDLSATSTKLFQRIAKKQNLPIINPAGPAVPHRDPRGASSAWWRGSRKTRTHRHPYQYRRATPTVRYNRPHKRPCKPQLILQSLCSPHLQLTSSSAHQLSSLICDHLQLRSTMARYTGAGSMRATLMLMLCRRSLCS